MHLLHLTQPSTKKRVFEVACTGFIARAFTKRNWAASTLPFPWCVFILYWLAPNTTPDPAVRVHEYVHVQQDQDNACFIVSWVRYGYEAVKERLHTSSWFAAYQQNRYEVQAYKVEDDVLSGATPWPTWARTD